MKKRLFVFACVVMTSVYLCGCSFSTTLKDALISLAEAIPTDSETVEETLADASVTREDASDAAGEELSEDGSEDGEGSTKDGGNSEDAETPEQKAERIRRENQEKQRQERIEQEKAEEEEKARKEEEEKAKKAEEEKKKKAEAEKKRQEEEKRAEEERKKQEEEQRAAEEQQQQQNTIADLEANAGTRMIELINAKRAEAGLAPLSLDPTLCALAKVRADEIVSVFDHTRPDGRSCFTVLSDNGVSYMAAGENIAAGYPSVEAAFNAWMNSEGHRANLMNPSFGKIGIGFTYSDGGYRYYWTQVFTD